MTMQTLDLLHTLTASQVLELYKNDTITVEDYAEALLARVKSRDSIVGAWAYLDMPTQFGSPLYHGFRPGVDASITSILRSAGAIIFGKTTTTEFTVPNSGVNTTNPVDLRRTPGGSSTGSAAAVADFEIPLSFGTQSGGSVIRPAGFTGTFAMKPTINAISLEGVKIVSFDLDTCGFFTRSLEDLQLLADLFRLMPFNSSLPTISLQAARIASVKTPMWSEAGPGTIEAMSKAAQILTRHGAAVEEVDLPSHWGDARDLKLMQMTLMNGQAEATFLKEYRMDRSKLSNQIRDLAENKGNFTGQDIVRAMDRFATMRREFDNMANKYDAIITPSTVDVAPLGLDDMGSPSFNFLWTALHVPVIHVPAFAGTDGMPVGLSVVAGRFFDQELLGVTRHISEVLIAEGGRQKGDTPVNGRM